MPIMMVRIVERAGISPRHHRMTTFLPNVHTVRRHIHTPTHALGDSAGTCAVHVHPHTAKEANNERLQLLLCCIALSLSVKKKEEKICRPKERRECRKAATITRKMITVKMTLQSRDFPFGTD